MVRDVRKGQGIQVFDIAKCMMSCYELVRICLGRIPNALSNWLSCKLEFWEMNFRKTFFQYSSDFSPWLYKWTIIVIRYQRMILCSKFILQFSQILSENQRKAWCSVFTNSYTILHFCNNFMVLCSRMRCNTRQIIHWIYETIACS